jgi:hypothetical protein
MDSFEQKYPHIAAWVQDGIVEIGNTDHDPSFIRVLDEGGMIWSGADAYPSLDNALAPAEHEIQAFFGVTPPTVHQMILRLEQLGFISRVPRQARSIEVLLPAETLPPLRCS